MDGTDSETDFICLECQQIEFERAIGLRATELQRTENTEGVWIADLGSRCSSSPNNGCALCQFLYAARCRPRKSHQSYQLRAYSYLRSTQTISFSRVPKYLLENDMPCLGIVPSGIKSRTFRVDTSEIGHVFCLDNTQESCPMFQQYTMTNAVDLDLVHTWIGFCKSVHGEICYSSGNEKQPKRLKLIDCDSNLVVDRLAKAPYAALSYVWGRPKVTTGNAASSHQSMKGSDALFSRTVSDAISVTKYLGMKFLWVDKYCIDQTNAEEKHDQIGQMGLIYQSSEITIIAAAGDDAESGLPGVGETQRKRQPIVKLRNHSVIRTMAHPHRTIPASKWATRGWTLQESVLSSRRLVFTENQVYFECGFMNCSESLPPNLLLIHNKSNYTYPFLHRGIFAGRTNKRFQAVNVSSLGGIECYLELTMDYSKRKLTYESDSYNAFTGIMEYFSREYGVHNIWGVPIVWEIFRSYKNLFARALLWYHKGRAKSSEGEACRRGFGLNGSSHMTNERAIWLPSWSWIGWCGRIAYPDYNHAVASWSLKDVRLEISGDLSPLAPYRESWSVASRPDALHLDVKVVTPDQMNLDDGSLPPAITLQNGSTTWFISRGPRDPRDLFKNLKSRNIELLHLLTECGACEDERKDFFLIVENHADYAERVGVVIRKGAGNIEGTHKVVRLR